MKHSFIPEADLEGPRRARPSPPLPPPLPPFFSCNHFEELQIVLLEVKLIIKMHLKHTFTQIPSKRLTLNHLLFGR